jgi:hypothetical protein
MTSEKGQTFLKILLLIGVLLIIGVGIFYFFSKKSSTTTYTRVVESPLPVPTPRYRPSIAPSTDPYLSKIEVTPQPKAPGGTVTMSDIGHDQTRVVLELQNVNKGGQTVAIHAGSCSAPGEQKYELKPVQINNDVNPPKWESNTILTTPLTSLRTGNLVIVAQDGGQTVVCTQLQ